MHTDEAVHAEKFGDLLEAGHYEYDPYEYHGPTLNYFTLVVAWLSGATTYANTTEVTLRIVPVAFSLLLILLTLFLVDGLRFATIPIALLAAASPALFFYSRYYIQETSSSVSPSAPWSPPTATPAPEPCPGPLSRVPLSASCTPPRKPASSLWAPWPWPGHWLY